MPEITQEPLSLDEARKRFPPIWVIYDRPKDYPLGFVVRCWYGLTAEETGYPFATLVQAQEYIVQQGGCLPLSRWQEDDPVILQTWL